MLNAFHFFITICKILASLCLCHHVQHQRQHYLLLAPPTPVTPLRAPPRPFASSILRHMGNHIALCNIIIQAPRWYISASLSSISLIQPIWIPICRHHRIRNLPCHWRFPTIEKQKDNRMAMRGKPTLPQNHELMIPPNHMTTGTTSPQNAAKGSCKARKYSLNCKLKKKLQKLTHITQA